MILFNPKNITKKAWADPAVPMEHIFEMDPDSGAAEILLEIYRGQQNNTPQERSVYTTAPYHGDLAILYANGLVMFEGNKVYVTSKGLRQIEYWDNAIPSDVAEIITEDNNEFIFKS